MDINYDKLESLCSTIVSDVKKKSKFLEVKEFWGNNKNSIAQTIRDWRKNPASSIFNFVKEYSSLLLRFMLTGDQYEGDVKSDLEYIYDNLLKNIQFGGRYIVDSYLKISNYNNSDQLKYDENYLLDNIKQAIECGISESAISALSKSYINKGIIAGIFDNPNECKLWTYLSENDKNYFGELVFDISISDSKNKLKSVSTIDDEVDLFKKLVADTEEGESENREEIIDDKNIAEENIVKKPEEEIVEVPEEPIIEEEPSEVVMESVIEEVKEEKEQSGKQPEEVAGPIIENKAEEEPEFIEEEVLDFDKTKINIVVISSETQMNQVRLAFSQDWLNRTHDLFNWPYHVDFKNDVTLLDGWVDAPKTSIRKIAKYDLIIIGHNDHILKGMPKEYTEGGKKDGGIKKCLLDLYNVGEGHVYFPEKNKRPDLSVTNLRACLCDYMSRHTKGESLL